MGVSEYCGKEERGHRAECERTIAENGQNSHLVHLEDRPLALF